MQRVDRMPRQEVRVRALNRVDLDHAWIRRITLECGRLRRRYGLAHLYLMHRNASCRRYLGGDGLPGRHRVGKAGLTPRITLVWNGGLQPGQEAVLLYELLPLAWEVESQLDARGAVR